MSDTGRAGPAADPGWPVRRAVLGLAGVGTLGVLVELAVSRHWGSAVQAIAWVSAGLLAVAVLLAWRSVTTTPPASSILRVARTLAALVCASSVFGIWEHVESNYDAGPLNFRYATSWAQMSEPSRWWKAVNGAVGAAPPIVPGALAFIALLVVAATLRSTGDRAGSGAGHAPFEDGAAVGPGPE